jgi:REP element-mobilizing transposase RayT
MTNGRGTRDQTVAGRVGATGRSPLQTGPHRHHRRSIRLSGYDYSRAGAYFVTVCTQDRTCLFGEVVDGKMRVNEFGQIVREEWLRTAEIRDNVNMDLFVVMPNHLHAILWLADETRRGDRPVAPTADTVMRPVGPTPRSVAAVMAGFKSASTKRINFVRCTPAASVWQRNYYEHIIRDEESLNRIREYIANNPLQWAFDRENTDRVNTGRVAADAGTGSEPAPGGRRSPAKDEPWRV